MAQRRVALDGLDCAFARTCSRLDL